MWLGLRFPPFAGLAELGIAVRVLSVDTGFSLSGHRVGHPVQGVSVLGLGLTVKLSTKLK